MNSKRSRLGRSRGRALGTLLLSFALLAGLLVACDSDDDGDATETPTSDASTPSTTTTPAPTTGGGGGATPPPSAGGDDSAYQSALDLMLQEQVGTEPSDEELAEAHFDIHSDGEGLPDGSGLASAGAEVYASQCASCHGANGEGAAGAPQLIIENAGPWQPGDPKVIGNYWPYATTVFDYVRRAMPFTNPGSLSNEEVYAVVAYLLAENGVIAEDQEMNAETLGQVEMPNRDNFFSCWPDECRPDVDGADAPGGGGEGTATATGTPPDEYEPTPDGDN